MHTSNSLNFSLLLSYLAKKNPVLGLDEFVKALNFLGVSFSETDYRALFAHFQANWNEAKIDWSAFVHSIYTEMSDGRREIVRKAYEKMDTAGTGDVTLDCVARSYNPEGNRDVSSGNCSAADHYNAFMGLWGLDFQDARVSFDTFMLFWENISPAFESDDDFVQMMTKCFGL